MASFVFLNVLAYTGVGFVVLSLLFVGILLLRPSTVMEGLAALIGEDRARECMRDGSLKARQVRAAGTLFLLLGCFIAVCIARDLQHV